MSESISKFKRAFGYGEATAEAGDGALGAQCRSAGAAWPGVSRSIKEQLDRLRGALVEEYREEGLADAIAGRFDAKVARFVQMLDGQVEDALLAVADARDPDEQAKLGKEARRVLAGYKALLQNKTLIDLDENPFVPLSIRGSLEGMLARVPAELSAA